MCCCPRGRSRPRGLGGLQGLRHHQRPRHQPPALKRQDLQREQARLPLQPGAQRVRLRLLPPPWLLRRLWLPGKCVPSVQHRSAAANFWSYPARRTSKPGPNELLGRCASSVVQRPHQTQYSLLGEGWKGGVNGRAVRERGGGGAKVYAPREPMAQRTQNLYSPQQKHQGSRHMPNKKLYGCFKAGARGSER